MKQNDFNKHLISSISINGMWGKFDVNWPNVNTDVNILVGPNGCGKSTLLRIIYNVLIGQNKTLDKIIAGLVIDYKTLDRVGLFENFPDKIVYPTNSNKNVGYTDFEAEYINTFDIPTARKSEQSQLLQMLEGVVYQNKVGNSFFDYRMRIVNFPELRDIVENRIHQLFGIINRFFVISGKQVTINPISNKLVFQSKGSNEEISLEQLSSGEKQLLYILFKVFIKDEQPFVLLMDEPEISLHIDWQRYLIEAIRQLNPNCQIILATHSPSVFVDGWSDKIVFMEDLVHPITKQGNE